MDVERNQDGTDDLDLIERLGVLVYFAPALPRPAIYVGEFSIALVREGLTAEAQSAAADWLLSEITRACPSPTPSPRALGRGSSGAPHDA